MTRLMEMATGRFLVLLAVAALVICAAVALTALTGGDEHESGDVVTVLG